MPTKKRHDFFKEEAQKKSGIYIPETPIKVVNNCKTGNFTIQDKQYGDKLRFVILKFGKLIYKGGDLTPAGTLFAQIWFSPVGKDSVLPLNLVYYTLVKNSRSGRSGSLYNLANKVSFTNGSQFSPLEVIWDCFFQKKTYSTTTEGKEEKVDYFVLNWDYTLPEHQSNDEFKKVGQAIEIFDLTRKLEDPSLDEFFIDVTDKSSQEIKSIIAQLKAQEMKLILAESNNNKEPVQA